MKASDRQGRFMVKTRVLDGMLDATAWVAEEKKLDTSDI